MGDGKEELLTMREEQARRSALGERPGLNSLVSPGDHQTRRTDTRVAVPKGDQPFSRTLVSVQNS